MNRLLNRLCSLLAATAVIAAGAQAADDPFPSTYQPAASQPTLIRNATVLDGTGRRLDGADVLMRDGRIVAVGAALAGDDASVIDARGRWVTPGLIDVHSHLGVYSRPDVNAHQDGNEATDPVTAGVWAEHGVWPQDPGFATARAGGVTTMQILPGSANLIGGRGVTLRNVPATTMQDMKFPGAPHGLKMACGENPKRVYGGKGRAPSTRMGNVAGYRQAFADAQDYRAQWDRYQAELAAHETQQAGGKARRGRTDPAAKTPAPPKRDLRLETLVAAMDGEIQVHIHCYRADEMAVMLDLAREFGFKVAAFHHGVEAYKVADRLAAEGVCGALWADWWGFKMEAYDAIW
jgi:imidazolonepropionase-like amidohydrolase